MDNKDKEIAIITPKKDSDLLRRPFEIACKQLILYLETGVPEGEILEVKLISNVVSNFARLRAVESHEAGLKLVAARITSENMEQLKETIKKTLPEYASTKED